MTRNALTAGLALVALVGGWLGARVAEGQPRLATSEAAQIQALQQQVQALQTWQSGAGVFTADGQGNWSFSPARGDVTIKSVSNANLVAATNLDVKAGTNGTIEVGANMQVKAGSNASVQAATSMQVRATTLVLNGGQHAVAAAGESTVSVNPGGAGSITSGSPTVLVP